MDINPINIELLSVFSRFHTQIKRVSKIACFESSTSFCEAITLYTMKTWALGGVWGFGEGDLHGKNIKNFQLHVDYGHYLGRWPIWPTPDPNRVNFYI